jgi:3-oxoadipate enol-lactonase
MKATVNGVTLNYVIEGREGAPWLTFSNSLATDLSMWDDQVAALKDDWRILRYDKRGHGASPAPTPPWLMKDLVADVIALWDSLGVKRSHFAGVSIGGMTALGLALDHADRVASITVADSRADAPEPYRANWPPRIEIATTKGMAPLADPTVERWFTAGYRAAHPDVIARFRKLVSDTSVDGYVGCGHALANLDYLPRIGQIKTPTLILCGVDDAMLEPSRDMHRRIPGSEYAEFGPAGHISNVEQPERFTAALSAFLAKHRAA